MNLSQWRNLYLTKTWCVKTLTCPAEDSIIEIGTIRRQIKWILFGSED